MLEFDAYVGSVAFVETQGGVAAAFALGDGSVRFASADSAEVGMLEAHEGAVLCATPHPSGQGLVTGGDDGRLVWSRPEGAHALADLGGKWIDAVESSPASGLIAFAAGREARVLDSADPAFERVFRHERSVAALAFDPKGRRLAAASYGGAFLWYARIAEQKPQLLKWAGSHVAALFSPDGRFLMTAMQENALHGWRMADGKDLKMGGYPGKPKSLAFLSKGALLATSGASGVVAWPFAGAGGPMGKEAAEIGHQEGALVTRVAATPAGGLIAAGLDDGRVWAADVRGRGVVFVKAERGAPISTLAISADGGLIAWGAEDGLAGVAPAPHMEGR